MECFFDLIDRVQFSVTGRIVLSSVCIMGAAMLAWYAWRSAGVAPAAPSTSQHVAPSAPPDRGSLFEEITAQVGLEFLHEPGRVSLYQVPQVTGSGCAFLDFDGDRDPGTVSEADTVIVTLDEDESRALIEEVPQAYGTVLNDALLTARAPSSFQRSEPHIARLFPDTRAAEIAYYKKTKMFPIMHLIGIRKTHAEKYPWLASSVYKAFCDAKAFAVADLRDVNALTVSLPWLEAETNETSALMGRDFWKYGVAENEPEIEALTEYLHEQGLVDRRLAAVELFHPSTFELAKV